MHVGMSEDLPLEVYEKKTKFTFGWAGTDDDTTADCNAESIAIASNIHS